MILRIIHDGSELAGRSRGDKGSGSPSTLSATTSPSLSSSRDESSVFCSSNQPGEDMRAAKKRDIDDLGLLTDDEDALKTLRTELKQWLQLEYAQERGEFWRLRASIVNDVVALNVPHAADTLRTSEDALLFYRTVEAEMASRGWQDVLQLLRPIFANTEIDSKDAEIQNAPACEGEGETDSVAASPASILVETEYEVSDTETLAYPNGEREGADAGLQDEEQACSGSSDVIAREMPAAVPIDKPCPSTSTPTSFDVAAGVSEIGRVGAGGSIGCADRALTAPADPHQEDVSGSGCSSSSDKNKTGIPKQMPAPDEDDEEKNLHVSVQALEEIVAEQESRLARRGTQSPGPVASEEPEEVAGLSHLFADDSAEDFHEVVDETEDDTQLAQNLTPLLRAHLLSVQKALKAFVVSVHGDEKKAVTKILSAARNYGLNDDMSMNQRGLRDLCVMVRGALARPGRTNDRATKRMLRRLLHMSTAAIWRKSRTLAEAVRWAAADAAAKSASYSHRVVYWFNTDDVAGNDEYFPEHVAAAEDADAADTVRKIDFSRPAPEHAPLAGEMLVQSNKNLMLAAGAQLEQKNTFFSAQPEVRELADEFLCPTAADIRAFVGKGDPEQEAGGLLQTTDAKVGVTACCSEREEGQWAYLKALALVRQMEQRAGFTADGLEVARFNDVSVSAVRNRVARMSLWLLAGGNQSRGSFLKAILALHVMQEFGLRLLSDDIELGRSGAAGEPGTPKRAPVRARIRQTLDVSADLLTLSDGDLVRSLLVKEGDLRTVLRILHECPGTFDVADRTIFWRVLSAGVTRVVSWIKGAQHRLERGHNSNLSNKFLPPPPVDVHVGLRPFVVPKKFTHRPRREIVAASARWALNRGVWITDLTALADARFRMPGINFYQFPNDMNDSLGRLVAAHAGRDGLLPEMAVDVLPDAEKSDAEHLNKALRLEKLLQAYTAEGFAGPRIVVEGENSAGRTKNESLLLRTQARFGDLRAEILAQGGGHGQQTGAHTTTSLEKTFYSVAGLRDLLRGPTQTDVGDGGTTETESHGASHGGHESSGIAVAEGSPGALESGHQHQDNYYARWIAVLMACLVPVLANCAKKGLTKTSLQHERKNELRIATPTLWLSLTPCRNCKDSDTPMKAAH
eukprot:g17197.t1